jgi:hypothetical protein
VRKSRLGGVVDLDREGDEGGGEVLDQTHRPSVRLAGQSL